MQLSRFPGPLASNPSSAPATPALVVLRVLTQTVNLLLVIVRETLETALRTGAQKTIVVGVDHLSIDQSSAESPSKVELKDSQDCPLMPGAKRHPLSARAVEPECLTGPAPPMGMASLFQLQTPIPTRLTTLPISTDPQIVTTQRVWRSFILN